MSTFGKILRALRNENDLTQVQLANKLGLAFSTISMYERGEREPDFETLEAIADFFNVTMDYLHGKSEIKNHGFEKQELYHPEPTHSTLQIIPDSISKNSILIFGEDTKSPVDDIEPFIASNKEMKMIMEYRTKPEAKNAINQIINKENPTVITNDEALMFALYGEDDKDITPDILEDVRKFAQFIRQKKKEDTI
jgi:transcriptional regulator with XRE-family HTH domain